MGNIMNGSGIEFQYANGIKIWYKNGKRHRIGGPAVEFSDSTKHWYENGLRHRIDGPAIEFNNGRKMWYENGKCHRIDGPARETHCHTYQEWHLSGIKISKKEYYMQ